MNFLAIFKIPLVRHILAGVIILGVGFYLGNKYFQKKLNTTREKLQQAKIETSGVLGKYEQLEKNYQRQAVVLDTLRAAILELAKKEHIKVDNHIKDTKVKRGGHILFAPKTKATIKKDSSSTTKNGFFKKLFGSKKNTNKPP